jgi:uncharacterized membrane protein
MLHMHLALARLKKAHIAGILVTTLAAILLGTWLAYTPPGLLGKADAVGYAVCHRIEDRSFMLGERQLPMCARCSGMYLGAFVALAYQFSLGRLGGMPSKKVMFFLAIFLVAFGIDGVNSVAHLLPGVTGIYEPQNWLRAVTGAGMGIGMGVMLYPVFNQTLWVQWSDQPAMGSMRRFGIVVLLAGLTVVMLVSGVPILLYPLALISAATVIGILTTIYMIVVLLLIKRENVYNNFISTWPALMAGFALALLHIGVFNLVRFILTGTWDGFVFG